MDINLDHHVQKAFHEIRKPFAGVRVLLGRNGTMYDLIVFESEVMALNAAQQEEFMAYLLNTKANIEKTGVTCGIVGERS